MILKTDNIFIVENLNALKDGFAKYSKEVNNTKELLNVVLSYESLEKTNVTPVMPIDKEEREWILKECDSVVDKLNSEESKYTRQAIFYNLHESGLEHNCISTMHFYYREGKLNLNVYVRSMNYEDNFDYDIETFSIALSKVSDGTHFEEGKITVFIMSLHKILEEII